MASHTMLRAASSSACCPRKAVSVQAAGCMPRSQLQKSQQCFLKSSSLQHRPPGRCSRSQTRAASAAASTTDDLPASLKQLVGAFQMVPDAMQRYKQLLYYAKQLPPMPQEEHVDENKVKGCVSQVWLVSELRDDQKLYWRADSDSELTKGLAALLVKGLSGCGAEEIVRVEAADVIDALGLSASLTPSRNNGFLNMFRLMQKKALTHLTAQADSAGPSSAAAPEAAPASPAPDAAAPAGTAAASQSDTSNGAAPSSNGAAPSSNGAASSSGGTAAAAAEATSNTPVQDSMRRKLTEALQPASLFILDESSQHAGHVGSRMKAGYSGETHFKVEVVSAAFEGLKTIKRHRMVYDLLKEELAATVHALSLSTKTPDEA